MGRVADVGHDQFLNFYDITARGCWITGPGHDTPSPWWIHGSYQGHTRNPSSRAGQKHQPLRILREYRLGFMLAGAVGVAGRRAESCNQQLQQLQPTEIPALYSRRVRRADVFGWLRCWDFWCGPGISRLVPAPNGMSSNPSPNT